MQAPTLALAFFAGLISFLSPCVLPLVPAYIGYLSGSAVKDARAGVSGGAIAASRISPRWIVVLHALTFVIGFTLVFAAIGGLAGVFSHALAQNRIWVQRIAGVMLFIFGLHMIGFIRIPFLDYTRRLDIRPSTNLGYLRSLLIGAGFGVGWTPCIGPTLGLIFTLSIQGKQSEAFLPFLAYAFGLGIPFMAAAFAMGQISSALKKISRRGYSLKIGSWRAIDDVNIVSLVSGALLVIMGLIVATNSLTLFAPTTNWFNF